MAPLRLPAPLHARLNAAAAELMSAPGLDVDFSQPPAAPALTPPDSVSWRIFKNPVSLYGGGVAAVLLELAEPRVRAGSGTTPASAPIPSRACAAPDWRPWSPSTPTAPRPSG